MALQQDVEKLRKKLRHEENVHRALERAFTRPLGALPRLPPYLPSQTLELLAEVAVLEEEVVRLEERVVSFRQGLYEEAIITSMAKNACFPDGERCTPPAQAQVRSSEVSTSARQEGSDQDGPDWSSLKRVTDVKQTPRRPGPSPGHGDRPGKENQSCGTNSSRDLGRRAPLGSVPKCWTPAAETCAGVQKTTGRVEDREAVEGGSSGADSDKPGSTPASKVSEELLTCLMAIFSQMSTSRSSERASSPSGFGSCESRSDGAGDRPYGVLDFGWRDIGRYKQFRSVDAAASFDKDDAPADDAAAPLGRRLKALLGKLSTVNQAGLSHQQRLAFWINAHNSSMMNVSCRS